MYRASIASRAVNNHCVVSPYCIVQVIATRARSTTEVVARMPYAFRTSTEVVPVNVNLATLETVTTACQSLVIAIS